MSKHLTEDQQKFWDKLKEIPMDGGLFWNQLGQQLPLNPSIGTVYFNTSDLSVYIYTGTTWDELSAT